MRRMLIIAALLLFVSSMHAQYRKGDGELMLLGTAGSMSSTTKYTWDDPGIPGGESSSSRLYLFLAMTSAYYFINGLAAELELGLRAQKGSVPTQSAILHLAYTRRYGRSIVAWFVRGGYGVSNGSSVPIYDELNRWSDGFDVGIVSVGAGLKIQPAGRALIRLEANYRMQMYTQELEFATIEYNTDFIALLVGIGLVL